MAGDVVLEKAATIERCLARLREVHDGKLDLANLSVSGVMRDRLPDSEELSARMLREES